MKEIISKELLSEVLGIQILEVVPTKGNVIWYVFKDCYEGKDFINVYELAHKCKEWAKNQGYYLLSALVKSSGICMFDLSHKKIDNYRNVTKRNTEPEAIFAACQWILDNKD